MSGVDERVETVREALECLALFTEHGGHEEPFNAECESCVGLAALDSLAAAVADLEQRADDAEKALAKYKRSEEEWRAIWPNAAAVVSAEPTEETA